MILRSSWIPLLFFLAASLLFTHCSPRSVDHVLSTKLGACPDESDPSLMCGTVTVFESPEANEGKTINLNVVVIPATRANATGTPIFWFDGGPGIAATKGVNFFANPRNMYRRNHDIVLIDVRGTGKSNPLDCPQIHQKGDLESQFEEMFSPDAVQECFDTLSKSTDLSQYTTTNIAYDIEEVRKYLDYEQISLYGLSYGTRVAQVYMRMFPESVQSSVLWSPMPMEQKVPVYHAQFAQQSIEKLFIDCTKDQLCRNAYPTFKQEFMTLQKMGEEGPLTYKRIIEDGREEILEIPWHAFHTKIRDMMKVPLGMRQIPYIINQAYRGNFEPFLTLYLPESSYNGYMSLGFYFSITCTEDIPFIDPEYAAYLSANTFTGNYRVERQMQACDNWISGNVPTDFSKPLVSDVPTLLLTGYFDPITPPDIVEGMVKTLSKAHLITIPNMSHTFEGLSNDDCFDKMVLEFIDRPYRRPNTSCINLMVPVAYRTE